jgi:uncharacterized membrane protein YgaE (UPF0421/DUF939 family)
MSSPLTGPGLASAPRAAGQAARRAARRVRLRRRLTLGRTRVRASWWGIAQSAVGGALAWELGERLLHHQSPFFASVAAIISLSTSYSNRLRRVIEIAVGVALGVGLGDLLVGVIGRGAWQLGLTVLIAMTIALFLDGGPLIVNQAALQAVFVVALPPPSGGYVGRWLDAALGGAVALVVAFVAPADPRPLLRRDIADLVHTVADALHAAAAADRAGDAEAAFQALEMARSTEHGLDSWRSSVQAAQEITRLSPLRRSGAREAAAHAKAVEPIDHAIRNLRVALRRLVAVIEAEPPPVRGEDPLTAMLDRVAGALYTIPAALRDPDGEGGRRLRAALTGAAGLLDPGAVAGRGLSSTVVVAQLRSAVIDLFALAGLDRAKAQARLP